MECLFLQDLFFVLLVLLPWPVSGKFTVIGPQQVIALVGGEAILPCHLSPQMDAQDMDVMWFYGESSLLVHQYKDRQDHLNHQHQEYKGRTEFLRDDISNGSVALKLHHIRPSDEGKYRCFFESSSASGEAEYQVYVEGKFTVIGPQQPVIAMVGEEAIFPCHLSPQMNAQDMDVMWFYGESSELVHHSKYGQDYLKYQHQEYKGRTEFLQDDISTGSVALKLRHIRPSDEGKYWCLFESSKTYGEAEYQVYVAGKGSVPHIYTKNGGNKSHKLVCTSTGWYPEPEVQWRRNQETLLPQDTTIKKEENGLFSVETSITVSMNSIGNVSCFIGNPLLRQKLEATFSLSDDLSQNNTPGIVIWIVIGVLVITVILILIFVIWKLKKGKGVNKKEPVSYALVKLENEFGVNKDELDVYKDEPGVDKEDPVSYDSVKFQNEYDSNTDRCDQGSRTLERIESNRMEEPENPGNLLKEQREVEPSSPLHQDEVQEGDQKEMKGNLSPSPDTLKRPAVNKEEPVSYDSIKFENEYDSNTDGCDQGSRTLERIESNRMEERENPGNLLKEQREVEPSSPSHQDEEQEGDQKEMEGNLSPSPDTLKRPGTIQDATVVIKDATDINNDRCERASRTLETTECNGMQKWPNPVYMQKEQIGINSSSLCHFKEVQVGKWKKQKMEDVDKDMESAWAGRPLERRERNGMQKWHNPGYMQNKQTGIKPFPFSHHEEIQKRDQKKMERNLSPSPVTLKEPDLQTAQKYRVDVTLDVSTVGPFLLPRMDGKSFSSSSHRNNIAGMESMNCVLGKERFTSGRCYWEVQVEDMMKWIVGLCKESVMRKQGCEITPINGFWTLSLRKENEYWILSSPPTRLHLGVAPKVMGVFLDYEAGCISFYNVTDDSHICTFQDTFREALQPCIGPSNLIHFPNKKKY
uniref:Butyrophilin-like protein 2 n=1 Tax=Sarcophilus harrisii TaxID=9305 RepID=A0A7N4UX60_SARHA